MATKRQTLEFLLEQGLVFVQLDPRVDGVVVPEHLRAQVPLGLNLSRNFHLETFEIDDDGVRASLSFKGVRSVCVLPWSAVFSMSADDKTYLFEDAVPPELARAIRAQARSAEGAHVEPPLPEPPPVEPPPRPRPQLRLVK